MITGCIINKRGDVLFQGYKFWILEDSDLIIEKHPDLERKGYILSVYDRFGHLLNSYGSALYIESSDGYFQYLHKKTWGYINIYGKECPSFSEDYRITDYGEGLFKVINNRDLFSRDYGRTIGYCNAVGDMVIRCNYQDAGPFSDGLASVKYNKKWGFINHKGEIVIDCIYTSHFAPSFNNGYAEVYLDGEKITIDKKGNKCNPIKKKSVPVYHDGLIVYEDKGLYGFINNTGNRVIPAQYERVGDFSDGLAYVESQNHAYFIDTFGQIIIKLSRTQSYIPYFKKGLAIVETSGENLNNVVHYTIDCGHCSSQMGRVVSSHRAENNGRSVINARLIGAINADRSRYTISIAGKNEGHPSYFITCKRYDRETLEGYSTSKLLAESVELEVEAVSKPFFSQQRRMYVSVASFPCSLDDLYSLTHSDSVSISFGNQVDTLAIRLTEDDVNQLRAALDPEYKYTPVVVKENKTEGKKEKQEKENVGTKKQIQSAIQRIKAINWNRDREKLKTLLQDPYSIAQIKRLNTLTTGEHAILSFVNGIKKKYNTSMLVQDIKRVEENERYNNKHTIIALFRSRDTTYSEELKRFLYDWHCAIGKKTYY